MTDTKKSKVGVPRTKEEAKDSSSLLPESLDAEENDQHEVQGGPAGRGHATVRAPPTVILDPSDYPGWAFQMRSLLEFADMWHLVDPAIKDAKVTNDEIRSIADTVSAAAARTTREATLILVSALKDPQSRRLLVGLPPNNPRAIWNALHRHFMRMTPAAAAALKGQLWTMRQGNSETVRSYADRIKDARQRLAACGDDPSDRDINSVFVNGLVAQVAGPVVALLTVQKDSELDLESLVEVARSEEARQELRRGPSSKPTGYAADTRESKDKRDHGKGPLCFRCKKPGHMKAECPQSKAAPPAAGTCPLPGHGGHKASECRKSRPPANGTHQDEHKEESVPQQYKGKPVLSMHTDVHAHAATSAVAQHQSIRKPALLDSGASRVIVTADEPLWNKRTMSDTTITVANGSELSNPAGGEVLMDAGGVMLHMKDALQHPDIDRSLLGVSAVLAAGAADRIVFTLPKAEVLTQDGTVLFTAYNEDGVYVLGHPTAEQAQAAAAVQRTPPAATDPRVTSDAELWHQRLGHRSYSGLRELLKAGAVRGVESLQLPAAGEEKSHRCHGCALGKAHRVAFSDHRDPAHAATHVLARVDWDVAGPFTVRSLGGAWYFLLGVDEWTDYGFIMCLQAKSDATDEIIAWYKQAATKHGRNVVELHSDGGGEFVNHKLDKFLLDRGTKHTTTVKHTPQHNGKAERMNRTMLEWANAMLAHAGSSKKFWGHAVQTAMYVRNRTVLRKKTRDTPWMLWNGGAEKPSVAAMRVFGCDADVVHTMAPGLKLPKLAPKSRLCMFVGYDEDKNAYKFYDARSGNIFSSRDATFYEQAFTVSHSVREADNDADDGDGDGGDWDEWLTRTTFDNETKLVQLVSAEEQESKYPEAAQPSSVLVEPAQSAPDAGEEEAPRRSLRERHGINRYGMINGNLAQGRTAFACSALLGTATPGPLEPRSHSEAVKSSLWKEAIDKELASHASNGTWTFVKLPAGRKAIGSKWVFKIKLKADGTVERAKARLTAKGFAQREGVDYHETFAPVLHYKTLRVVLALVAAEDYELQQLDVETAFLNATVTEDLYMQVPEGVTDAPPGTVCKLVKALYGIKQAPHAWNGDIDNTLLELGYTRSEYDECLYIKMSRTGRRMLIPLFVDDAFPAFHHADLAEYEQDKAKLMAKYKLKDGGDATLILGMRVTRNRERRTLTLDQEVYVNRLLADCGLADCKSERTPQVVGDNAFEDRSESHLLPLPYAALTGSLQYAALSTRPDIGHAVNMLTRGLSAPTKALEKACMRVLRYLKGCPGLGITFGGDPAARTLAAYCDADWGGPSSGDGHSTTGWLVKIGTGPVSWCSKKQSIVALSSTESEYIAAGSAVQELLWLRGMLQELGAALGTTTVHCDNQGAKALAESSRHHARTKHINVRYHFIRHHVSSGEIKIDWIPTAEQQADILTKALGPQVFLPLRDKIMGAAPEHKLRSPSSGVPARSDAGLSDTDLEGLRPWRMEGGASIKADQIRSISPGSRVRAQPGRG
jgi:hypothetical protein